MKSLQRLVWCLSLTSANATSAPLPLSENSVYPRTEAIFISKGGKQLHVPKYRLLQNKTKPQKSKDNNTQKQKTEKQNKN